MTNIQLAGIPIQLDNHFEDLPLLCRDYATNDPPKLHLSVSREEIEAERAIQADIFTDGYLETVCLYRKLALEILHYDVFLMHASVIEVDGEGYAFLAHSGTGKTTQTRLWLEHFGGRARVFLHPGKYAGEDKGSQATCAMVHYTLWKKRNRYILEFHSH